MFGPRRHDLKRYLATARGDADLRTNVRRSGLLKCVPHDVRMTDCGRDDRQRGRRFGAGKMAEETWQPARLIPTSGISGPDEQETRATSALLAVLPIIRDFTASLLRPFGAPSGAIETFIEVPLLHGDGRTIRPDGLIQITRGSKSWTTLVEVKTGNNDLGRDQVESYLDVAKDNGFDAVLTISNQISPAAGVHPVDVDRRKLRKVALHHVSWAEIVSAAVLQRVHRGVADPEQAWILAELIRYLEHPRSGALDFTDMGGSWVPVRESVLAGTLRASDKSAAEVVSRWDQLLRFAALRLERDLGSGVQVALSRKEQADPTIRAAALTAELVTKGTLSGTLRVPNTVGDLMVTADLRTGRCTIEVDVTAPGEGRPLTRVNWLVRQLADANDAVRIDAYAHMARTSVSGLLKAVRVDPTVLLADSKVDLRRFRIAAASQLGTKRGVGRGSFIDSILAAIDGYYQTVLQGIRPWVPKAPQLPKAGAALAAAGIDTTVLPDERADLNESIEELAGNNDTVDRPAENDPASASAPSDDDGEAPLVSWDEQQDDIREERSAGIAADDQGFD